MITEIECRELDRRDPLAFARERFDLSDGVIYLDGNSLGPPVLSAKATLGKLADDWQSMLIRGWWTPAGSTSPGGLAIALLR